MSLQMPIPRQAMPSTVQSQHLDVAQVVGLPSVVPAQRLRSGQAVQQPSTTIYKSRANRAWVLPIPRSTLWRMRSRRILRSTMLRLEQTCFILRLPTSTRQLVGDRQISTISRGTLLLAAVGIRPPRQVHQE